MSTCLGDIIRFRDDKLFQGAVDISWFYRDRDKAEAAAAGFCLSRTALSWRPAEGRLP